MLRELPFFQSNKIYFSSIQKSITGTKTSLFSFLALKIPLEPCYGKPVEGLFPDRLMTIRTKVYDEGGKL
jgi:hypothetical protein